MPSNSECTSREPGKNVLKPALHEPEVYIPLFPLVSVDCCGADPLAPIRGSVLGMPRQMGGDGVEDTVAVGVRVMEALPVGVRVMEALPVAVRVMEALPVPVLDGEPVPVGVREKEVLAVPVGDAVPVPEALRVADELPVPVADTEPVLLRDGVLVAVAVLVLDADVLGVAVREPDTEGVGERVCELDAVPVRVAEVLAEEVRVWEVEGVPVGDAPLKAYNPFSHEPTYSVPSALMAAVEPPTRLVK